MTTKGGTGTDTPTAAPLKPLPWAVWLLVLTIAGVELVLWAGAQGLVNAQGSAGWRTEALALFGVTPAVQGWMIETRQAPVEHLWRYLTFGYIHPGPLQAFLVVVITAALGKFCAERTGSFRLVLLVIIAQVVGGFSFGLTGATGAWLIGGYPLIFALAGAHAWLGYVEAPSRAQQIRAFGVMGALILARLALGVWMESGATWVADLSACAAGFALAAALRPGAGTALLAGLRRR